MAELSQGQSRKLKVALVSIAVFLVTTYLVMSYFSKLFGNSGSEAEAISTFDMLKVIAPYTLSLSFTVFGVLSFFFVRESNKVLPKGFYTKTSWLDIKHNSLVHIDHNDLVVIKIDDGKMGAVQDGYQNKASLEELTALSKSDEIIRIPLNEVKNLTSEHNAHYFSIEQGEKTHSVDFMMPLVKAHALQTIKRHLPSTLDYDKRKKTRFEAIMAESIVLIILAAIGYFVGNITVSALLIAFGVIVIMPSIIKSLANPPIVESWESDSSSAEEELEAVA